MGALQHSIVLRADRAALFALTQDYQRRLEWDPFLREARLLDGAPRAEVGARAWCVAWYGLGMETEYITLVPPRLAAVRMTRGPWLLRAFAGSWRFDEVGPDQTRITFRYHFTVRPGLLAPLLAPLMRAHFARDTRRRLEALKEAVEQRGLLGTKTPALP
jgi:ribosome-associated toxin RatA of RatAB toxin-antitoxin module